MLGREGVEWMLEASEDLPLDVFVMAPSCVPASDFESPGQPLEPADMEAILRHPRALGVAEMMNFPGVIAGAPDVLARLELSDRVDGHAPGVMGRALDAYVAAGIRSDHEATTLDEALEKRRRGMWVLIREASNARNLRDLLPLVGQYGPEHCAFCTDDREPDFLYREGHIDQMCRVAVEEGCSPEAALLMATLHPARCHGLLDRGAIAPGLRADLVLLDDLEDFRPARVYKDGRLVAADGRAEPFARPPIPDRVRSTMRAAPLPADAFAIPAASRVRVIETIPGQLITHAREERPATRDGLVVADPRARQDRGDRAPPRHRPGRPRARARLRPARRRVRLDRRPRRAQPRRRRRQRRGHGRPAPTACRRSAAASSSRATAPSAASWRCRSPACLSDEPVEDVVEALESLQEMLRDQGVQDSAPFMTLSFLALSVIPSLKITDRGLVDVDRFELVPLAVDHD